MSRRVSIAKILSVAFTLGLFAGHPVFAATDAPPTSPAATSQALVFPWFRLGLNNKPPARCETSIYGAVSARAPDGAVCVCRQGKDGNPAAWIEAGTAQHCWPENQ